MREVLYVIICYMTTYRSRVKLHTKEFKLLQESQNLIVVDPNGRIKTFKRDNIVHYTIINEKNEIIKTWKSVA